MSLFMCIFMGLAAVGCTFNAVMTFRDRNTQAAIAWSAAGCFALGAFFNHLAAFLGSST